MFLNLYKLYHRSNKKTPLEDFNTECFAGFLKYHQDILVDFISFIGMPKGEAYKISTQEYFPLSEDPNCFIDLVLESETAICFIENKVNASESGDHQLLRYSKVLNSIEEKECYLVYCTKWSDVKQTEKLHSSFQQIRWHEIAYLLRQKHFDKPMVKDYLEFLNTHNMSTKIDFSINSAIALKEFENAFSTVRLHLENAKQVANEVFPKIKFDRNNSKSYKDFVQGNRMYFANYHPIASTNLHSEILFAVHIKEVLFQVQIWIDKNNPQCKEIILLAEKSNLFDVTEIDDFGGMINNNIPIYNFLETENTDEKVRAWFRQSFENIKEFIKSTPQFDWRKNLSL